MTTITRLRILFIFGWLAAGGVASADDDDVTPSATAPQSLPEAILGYLTQDRFIDAGTGFREVRIGHPLEHALEVWGPPRSVSSRGLLRRTHRWNYQPDEHTRVILVGRQRIEEIQIIGTLNSGLETTRGTRFGMAPYEVAAAYGPPPDQRAGAAMEFPGQGIRFEFTNGQMSRMDVFAPVRTR